MNSPSPRKLMLLLAVLAAAMLALTSGAQAIIYGLESTAGLSEAQPSLAPTNVFSFAENGSGLTVYGSLKIGTSTIDADGLAYHPTYGLLGYELKKDANNNVTGSQLIQITAQVNPTAVRIGNVLNSKDIRGAVFIGAHLWVLDRANNQYLEINPTTGAVISTNNFSTPGFSLVSSTDLARRLNGATYLVNQDKYYTFNMATGAVTLVYTDGGTGNNQFVGLAFSLNAPANRIFSFDVSGTDDIFYYNADSFATSKTLLYGNFSPLNAGRGDLAAYVPLPPSMLLLGAGLIGLWGLRRRRS